MKKGVWKRAGNHARFLLRIAWIGGRAWVKANYGVDIGDPPTKKETDGSEEVS